MALPAIKLVPESIYDFSPDSALIVTEPKERADVLILNDAVLLPDPVTATSCVVAPPPSFVILPK